VRISYQSIGSGAGVEQFIQGTVDFAASDVAITDEQASVKRGDHATDDRRFDSASLQPTQCASWFEATTESLHRYLPGEYQELNDPRIAAANPGVNLPDLPIRAYTALTAVEPRLFSRST